MVLICSNIFIYLPNINVVFDGLDIDYWVIYYKIYRKSLPFRVVSYVFPYVCNTVKGKK